MSQQTQWYVSQEGQQLGPYTDEQMVSFAQGGNITRQSMVWAEGMADWLPAAQINGLFPAAAATGPGRAAPGAARPAAAARGAAQPAAAGRAVATQPAGPSRAGAAATAVRPTQGPAGRSSGPATSRGHQTQPQAHTQSQTDAGAFPRPPVPVASFGMFAGAIALGLVFGIIGGVVFFMAMKQAQPDPAMMIVVTACLSVAGLCMLLAQIFGMINLYRAWLCLSRAGASISPGMAVGLLFVPVFNIYWSFRAFYGFAQEWNRLTYYYEDTRRGPKMSEGLFLAFCILGLVLPPVSFILIFPVMSSMCTAINFIARRPLHARGPVRPR